MNRFKECPNCETRYFNVNKRLCTSRTCDRYKLESIKIETQVEVDARVAEIDRKENYLQELLA